MKKVAAMLKRRFENIITYLTHPITNATSESINAKIQHGAGLLLYTLGFKAGKPSAGPGASGAPGAPARPHSGSSYSLRQKPRSSAFTGISTRSTRFLHSSCTVSTLLTQP